MRRSRSGRGPRTGAPRSPAAAGGPATGGGDTAALSTEERAALIEGVARLVPARDVPRTIGAFETFLAELRRWSRRVNLVSPGDRPRLVRRHVLESLACVPLIDRLGGGRLVDIGSGGGFPGIPLKLVRPALEVALVESRRMKSVVLQWAVQVLGLRGMCVWRTRAEDLASLPAPGGEVGDAQGRAWAGSGAEPPAVRPQADLLTARAVAPLAEIAGWAAPIVRPGGHLVAFKGSTADEELRHWLAAPGSWHVAAIEREAVSGLTLVVLKRNWAGMLVGTRGEGRKESN